MPKYPKPLSESQQQVADMVAAKAQEMGVPVDLALAMAYEESKFIQADAKGQITKSSKGALGIMQVLPDTARQYKFNLSDLKDPEKNITAGLTYLKDLLDQSNGVGEIAAAKYNWGPGRKFFQTGEGELPAETDEYIRNITKYGGFGGPSVSEQGPPPDKQFVEVPAAPKVGGETQEEDGTPPAERGAGVPQATLYSQESTPEEDAQIDKQLATGAGGALGAMYGFAESRLNNAETRAMREEMARERVRAQYAQMQAQQAADSEGQQTRIRLQQSGALSEAPATGGTSGEKWSRNWRGVETPGSRSVPESASMYQRGKVQGGSKVSQRINKLYPKLSPNDPNAIWERLSLQSDQRAAAAAEQAMQQRLLEEQANQQRLIQIEEDTNRARAARLEANRPINQARAALTSLSETPAGQVGSRIAEIMYKRIPVLGYGAAGANIGRNISEANEALRNKEYIDAILAASEAAATGASMYPPFAPIAVPAGLGIEAMKQARDYYR